MFINKNIAISESGFLFDPQTGDSFNTNAAGQEVVRLLQAGKNHEEVLDALEASFGTDRDTLEKDLTDFYLMLRTYRILHDEA